MPYVTVRKGEDINRAIRRFKRKVEREGIMRELKKKRYYLKPSERRKEKREAAAKRRRKMKSRTGPRKQRQ
jgi:small subunit ribosomal protein S21